MKEQLEIENEPSEGNNNNNINNSKYEQLFDKYKEEDGLISKNGLNQILNECGIEITLDQSENLIKNVNNGNQNEKLDYNKFVELMESEIIININGEKTLSNIKIIFIFILLIFTGFIIIVTTRLIPQLKSSGILFDTHKQIPIFCMF